MEKRTEVKTYKVELVCVSCGEGTMELGGSGEKMSYPAQYPHICTECGAEIHVIGTTYPYMEYE